MFRQTPCKTGPCEGRRLRPDIGEPALLGVKHCHTTWADYSSSLAERIVKFGRNTFLRC